MKHKICLVIALILPGLAWAVPVTDKRMVILGVDGMDPVLLRQYMDEGIMPNLSHLANRGGMQTLGTSTPPQSPVAWSNFITGMNPGGHGIFDFLALDRSTMIPYLSTARIDTPSQAPIAIGRWRIPLGTEHTIQRRDGQTFWQLLEAAGVSTTMFRIPANYPPVETSGKALSGMGTPDLRGTPGLFSFYTNAPDQIAGDVAGGSIEQVTINNNTVQAKLKGPANHFIADTPPTWLPFTVDIDPTNPVARIRITDQTLLLNSGEWSDWLPIRFSMVKNLVTVPGMVRFYLKQTSPHFQLYASPVNIDPLDPAQNIATPPDYASELAIAAGRFYTQEMPEDTKALSAGVLTAQEFLAQSALILDERRRLLEHEIQRFKKQQNSRLLFFYISSMDQRHHMLYHHTDPTHPHHKEHSPPDLVEAMRNTYQEIDELIGGLLIELDKNTAIVVMSDHGFAPFHRQANLNRWLEEEGYLTFAYADEQRDELAWLQGIDWSETEAFAIGLNSLYINVEGREEWGIVPAEERQQLARDITNGLARWRDEKTGQHVVSQPLLREAIYHGQHLSEAPDIIVGYARGYRASWATTSGSVPNILIDDNLEEWSGDHCIDSREVPGVLISNQTLGPTEGNLQDLTVTILNYFGVVPLEKMRGRSLFKPSDKRGELAHVQKKHH